MFSSRPTPSRSFTRDRRQSRIGERRHGGNSQALYACGGEELDDWEARLERDLPNGFFGENLTTRGIDVNEARLGGSGGSVRQSSFE